MGNWFSSTITNAFREKGIQAIAHNMGKGVEVIAITPEHIDTLVMGEVNNGKAIFTIIKGTVESDDARPILITLSEPYDEIIINEIVAETQNLSSSSIFKLDNEDIIRDDMLQKDIDDVNEKKSNIPDCSFSDVIDELKSRWD